MDKLRCRHALYRLKARTYGSLSGVSDANLLIMREEMESEVDMWCGELQGLARQKTGLDAVSMELKNRGCC